MKRNKVITFEEYYMDLNAFHESIKTHYFKNKPVYFVECGETTCFPFGKQTVMKIHVKSKGQNKKKEFVYGRISFIVVGPEIFIERAFNEFVNRKNAGEL